MILSNLILFLVHILTRINGLVKYQADGEYDEETQRFDSFADLVAMNLKTNGWNNIIIFGDFPINLYQKLEVIPFTFVVSNTKDDDYYVEDAVPYHSNTILMNCVDFGNFEESLLQVMSLAYWHPHANIYLYYHTKTSQQNIAKMFFIFWYYRACNVIIVQFDGTESSLLLTHYTPFLSDIYELENKFGCWTAKKLGMPIYTFEEDFVCEENCHNVSQTSKLRATSLGTCLGFKTRKISVNDALSIQNLKLFEDKGSNFHGYAFRAFTTEVLPFMSIKQHPNNSYSLSSRDGLIWSTMSDLLNFTIDLTPSANVLNKPFDFEINIQQIFAVAHRKGDLFLIPIYQFDVIVVEIDYTFAYRDSGVCFMSRRADFETVMFDLKTLIANYDVVIQFGLSFLLIWAIFCLYSGTETRQIDMDFFGKNFMNSVRSILLINLQHPPKRTSFRLFLTITIWSYFIINFSTQAAIISFFTAFKRGREVNTFDDIVEKGYIIEGMASPDVVLPDTEERFRKINSKLSPIRGRLECVDNLANDSQRFCLVDCSVGQYLERNMLNAKGEHFLHIAKDRVHNYYLNFIFSKYSIISDNFNKYLMILYEAGLIKKWEQYRNNDIKEEALTKPLRMNDVIGIFHAYILFVMVTIVIFLVELCVGNLRKIKARIPPSK